MGAGRDRGCILFSSLCVRTVCDLACNYNNAETTHSFRSSFPPAPASALESFPPQVHLQLAGDELGVDDFALGVVDVVADPV